MDEEINEAKIVKLKSMPDENGDVRVFEVMYGAARISELVRDSVGGIDDDEESEMPLEVDVLRVKGDCLEKVVDFMKHFNEEKMKEIPTPLGGSSFNEVMDQKWYQDFVDDANLGSRDMLFDLLTAANFMGIKELLDLTCLKVTFQLTGKTAEEIRQILRLPELTPEEESQAREDHKWIFEDS
jgi:S-phase kinase-associated protein 1